MTPLYKDPRISMTDEGITISSYYFPLGGAKLIPWNQIRSVASKRMSFWSGKAKLWGMGFDRIWLHEDSSRYNKDFMLVLDTGSFIKPGITPDQVELAEAVITAKLQNKK